MKRLPLILCLAAAVLAACGEETRDGQLTLTGSTPLRLVDQSGKTVEFGAGATKVVFSADSSRKFTVTVSQGKDKQAKFSGQAPSSSDWNFTLRGRDIGQPVDLSSSRSVAYVGQPWTQMRDGAPCGYNGTMLVEDEYQSCNEDWNVAFADANNGQAVGTFRSQRDNQTCLISERDVYCQDRGPYPPYPPYPRPNPRRFEKAQDTVQKLNDLSADGVKFD